MGESMNRWFVPCLTVLALVASPATASAPTAGQAAKIARKALRRSNAAYALASRVALNAPAQGVTGAQGAPGADGKPGRDGSSGTNGADGARGPAGPEGPQGPRGLQGEPGAGVRAYGYVSATGDHTTTQGATVTHPGLGVYCVTAAGLTVLTVTPDTWGIASFVQPPGSTCGDAWTVVLQGQGQDSGFYFLGQ